MMCLSRNDIEIIGQSVLRDYTKRTRSNAQTPIDIERFARNYLGVQIQHRKLSESGDILGLTTYRGLNLKLTFPEGDVFLSVPEDTILLEERLLQPKNHSRWRFTLAHECAHQILARIEEKEAGSSFRKTLAPGKTYSCRDLKSAEHWSEWQANSLGAVLLMPKENLLEILKYGDKPRTLIRYGNRFNPLDYAVIKRVADMFRVSLKAMELRIGALGYIAHRPESEYTDPLDIFDD